MKKTIALGLLAAFATTGLIGLTAAPAEAGYKNRVNHRQVRQQKRIFQGTSSGALTGKEYRRLQKQQAHLAAKEAKFRISGNGLTKKEAAKLEVQQDALSKNIYRQKHDGQTQQ